MKDEFVPPPPPEPPVQSLSTAEVLRKGSPIKALSDEMHAESYCESESDAMHVARRVNEIMNKIDAVATSLEVRLGPFMAAEEIGFEQKVKEVRVISASYFAALHSDIELADDHLGRIGSMLRRLAI